MYDKQTRHLNTMLVLTIVLVLLNVLLTLKGVSPFHLLLN